MLIPDLSRRSFLAGAVALKLPRKIRIAIIGLEGHMSEILRPLPQLPGAELVAVCDKDEKAMARHKVRHYTDYRRLLESEQVDVIGIGGENGGRAAIIQACAAHKIHIVAEKPVAIQRTDLEAIKKSVDKNNVRLTMLLPMRFSPSYMALKKVVDDGEIGEVAQIDAQKSYKLGARPEWMKHHGSYGGTIPYIAVHMVDLMRWASGRELTEAASFQSRVGYPELGDMENTTATIFRLDNGGAAALHMDYLRPETAPTHGDDRLRLAGTKGVVEYMAATGLTVVTGRQKPRVITELPAERSLFMDFLDSVYNGKPSGLPLQDIYRVNEIVLAAREAAEKRQIVKTA